MRRVICKHEMEAGTANLAPWVWGAKASFAKSDPFNHDYADWSISILNDTATFTDKDGRTEYKTVRKPGRH